MKKIMIMMCMIGSSMYAQDNYFSGAFGFDIKNGFVGSKPTGNEPALDWTAEIHAVVDDFDYNLGYEQFSTIKFDRKYMALGYHFYMGDVWGTNIKFSIQPSIELSRITREYNESYTDLNGLKASQEVSKSWTTPSLNVNFNWDINKYFAVQLASNWLPRPDVRDIYHQKHSKYVLSEGIKGVIKLPM